MPDVPPLLAQAAEDAQEALRLFINARETETAQLHAAMFRQYRDELERVFFAYTQTPLPDPDKPGQPPQPIWRGADLKRAGRDQELVDSFQSLIDALNEVDTEAFASTLDLAAEEGFDRELYMLALGGLDTEDLLDLAPEDWDVILRDAAFDEVDWERRLDLWSVDTSEKMRRWMTGTAIASMPWGDTLDGYNAIAAGHTNHVTGLFGNELARAFSIGALLALVTARQTFGESAIREVWMTRQDGLVCLVCARLHMTVTAKQPVDDSHPGCRCIKVPVPAHFHPVEGLSFDAFRQGGDDEGT